MLAEVRVGCSLVCIMHGDVTAPSMGEAMCWIYVGSEVSEIVAETNPE